jgi:hypothetical protein
MDGILHRFLSGAGVVLAMLVNPHSYFDDKPSPGHGFSFLCLFFCISKDQI